MPTLEADVLVADPPYGLEYSSSMTGHDGGAALPGIVGDEDTALRDWMLEVWGDRPAVCFGSWKRPRPEHCKALLIWDKGDHVGMGDLSLPWKPNTEEIYVFGTGFSGRRNGSVLQYNAPVTWNSVGFGRRHPHQKPLGLMRELVGKCPPGVILDPFAGSGTTLLAAKLEGREAIGVEIEREHCETIVRRLRSEPAEMLF